MIPDLRPPATYNKPLPKWLQFVYAGATAFMLLAGTHFGLTMRSTSGVEKSVEYKKAEMIAAKTRMQTFNSSVEGLEAARTLRASLAQWKASSHQTAALQAAALIACAETEEFLTKLAKSDAENPAKRSKVRQRDRRSVHTDPTIVVRSLNVADRPEAGGGVDLTIEITHNSEGGVIIPQMNTRLAAFSTGGLSLASFATETRGGAITIRTQWRSAPTLSSSNTP